MTLARDVIAKAPRLTGVQCVEINDKKDAPRGYFLHEGNRRSIKRLRLRPALRAQLFGLPPVLGRLTLPWGRVWTNGKNGLP